MTYDEALDWLRRNPGKLLCAPFDSFGERYRIDPENPERIQAGFFQHIGECEKCSHVTKSGFEWMRTVEPHERLGNLVPLWQMEQVTDFLVTRVQLGDGETHG